LWQSAYVPATVSFDVVWNGPVTRRVNVRDATNGFAGQFNEDQATVTWSAHSDSGFTFTSEPGNFSTSVPEVPGVNGVTAPLNFFAQVGHERNGIFFPSAPSTADASLVRALSGAAAAPVAAPLPWSPRTDEPGASGLDREQPLEPAPAPRSAARATHAQVVDQVFADAGGLPAWAV
jgi:hypothetical protein